MAATKERIEVRGEMHTRVVDEEPTIVRAGYIRRGIALTDEEINLAYSTQYPPIITLEEASEIARCSPATLKRRICQGEFKVCTKTGKPLRFWRNRFVKEVMRR